MFGVCYISMRVLRKKIGSRHIWRVGSRKNIFYFTFPSRTSRRLTPSRYSLITRSSPCQTGRVRQSVQRGHSLGLLSRHATGEMLPSVSLSTSPTGISSGSRARR